jgi:hypothetical protein
MLLDFHETFWQWYYGCLNHLLFFFCTILSLCHFCASLSLTPLPSPTSATRRPPVFDEDTSDPFFIDPTAVMEIGQARLYLEPLSYLFDITDQVCVWYLSE